MKDRLQALQETLYREIPITKHLGITVESYDDEQLTLKAPIEPNRNHKQTAFAGSLNAVMTLAGWGLLWLVLGEQGLATTIVIQDSESSYLRPVTNDFSARCRKPNSARLVRFENILRNKGKARLELLAEIDVGEEVAVLFKGRYVVFLHNGTSYRDLNQ
jgi:thioesterase domain-containing protein